MKEKEILEEIKKGKPFEGLTDIRIIEIQVEPSFYGDIQTDVVILLGYGDLTLRVFGEIKAQVSPKILYQLGLWLKRAKALNPTETYALICPFLSPQSQKYCRENNIDFIDLSGNILLRVPSKILIERLGRPNLYKEQQVFRDPFGGKSSRVIRVLLEFPNRTWTVTDIKKELLKESQRQKIEKGFQLSVSSISKTIQSLEEELLIRREGARIIIPSSNQILFRWAVKYRERYIWHRLSSLKTNNPFGLDINSSISKLKLRIPNLNYVVTSTAAANLIAPFANVDIIDVFLPQRQLVDELRNLNKEQCVGPDFLFILPYDVGIAMYSQEINGVTVASPIQVYLDCYARGGRDAKQADYLLTNVIKKQWNKE
jgi:hypothetical protein